MGLTVEEIGAVVEEIRPVLTGGWIQKISQPSRSGIVLDVRVPGQTVTLYLSADPKTARIHVLSQKRPNPPTPPPFCQFLRARIQGARIERIVQEPGDRIVRIGLTARAGPMSLVAELIGRKANLLLLDGQETVLATLHEDRNRVGRPYQYPPPRPTDPSETSRTGSTSTSPPPRRDCPFPVCAALEEQYAQLEAELECQRLRQARLTELRHHLTKVSRRLEALRTDLARVSRYEHYARYGELLKANLHRINKGDERITVVDWFDPTQSELVIVLDPAKPPRGNMEDYFNKYRKYVTAKREILPRIAQLEQELAALHSELQAIQEGSWRPPASSPQQPSPKEAQRLLQARSRSGPFRRFTSADGLPIYVGRNAKENEDLTLRFAHGDDLWLHARGVPGSHVVVRLERGTAPPPETLLDAATLALLYSELKKNGKGEIIYTRRKYVRKAKGQPLGEVTVTQEKAIHLQLDRARLARLKDTG